MTRPSTTGSGFRFTGRSVTEDPRMGRQPDRQPDAGQRNAPSGRADGALGNAKMADPTGFEPAISSVTGWHVGPLHHGASCGEGGAYQRQRGLSPVAGLPNPPSLGDATRMHHGRARRRAAPVSRFLGARSYASERHQEEEAN